jgi:protein O-GlcNAc transferase
MKPARNDLCPCGSGKKYKKCCIGKPDLAVVRPSETVLSPSKEEYAQIVALYGSGKREELEYHAKLLIERYPQSAVAWKLWGACLQALGKDSLEALHKALELGPDDTETYNFLGVAYSGLGKKDEAIACYHRALAINPNFPAILCNLANLLTDKGGDDEAEIYLRRALELAPELAEVHQNLGALLKKTGRLEDARHHTHMAVKLKPTLTDAHFNLGIILQELKLKDDAETCFRNVLSLQATHVLAHVSLGNILAGRGDVQAAEAEFRQAMQLNPNATQAHIGLSSMFFEFRRMEEAESVLKLALVINPGDWVALCNLGPVLTRLGQTDKAVTSFQRTLQIRPEHAIAYNGLAVTLNIMGRRAEGEIALRQALKLDPRDVPAHSNLLSTMNFRPESRNEEMLALAREFDSKFCAVYRDRWPTHANTRVGDRRLRIGYVSPDFRHHAVAYFLEPILANHDKSQVEIFCYAEEKGTDDFTLRFRALADGWRSTLGMSDDAMAQAIFSDQIDILVDLAGHSEGNRLLALARKPAPIQMTYLGYPGTTGMAAIDYKIVDNQTIPLETIAPPFSENLLRLPDSLWCYRPTEKMPEPSPLPALKNGFMTFGSFNNFNKVDQETLALWAQLLKAIPASRLMMLTVSIGDARERLIRQFAEQGIAAERLEFHGKMPFGEFHQRFLEVDISLDPLNVNGATTTCESLWMGVPVISLVGSRFLTRAGLSLLTSAGVPEFLAHSPDDYIRIAVDLARDPMKLDEIRASLRERLRASPLADEVAFTRHLENLYREVWKTWCAR